MYQRSFSFFFQCILFHQKHVRGYLSLFKLSFTFHSSHFPKCFNNLVYYKHQHLYPRFAGKYLNDNLFKISKKHYITISDKLNDTHGKNLCFTEFSTKIHWNTRLAASNVFHMFKQSIKFFWFHYCTNVWKTWFIR